MLHAKIYLFFIVCCILIFVQSQQQPNIGNSATIPLCNLKTNELIEYYGYRAEVHNVTTEDQYILTVFRCNSKNSSIGGKKVVVCGPGFLFSSDDFCMNTPTQGLAYVMADAGYDVWLLNPRGNYYSRNHVFLSPSDPLFWDFTFVEIGIYDFPAIFNYIINITKVPKLFFVSHSQGSSSMMALLSEKPEYNNCIYAISFMAPAGYWNHVDFTLGLIQYSMPALRLLKDTELLPRRSSAIAGTICGAGLEMMCANLINVLIGYVQRNETLVPTCMCHTPSGASMKQLLHWAKQIQLQYFGNCTEGLVVPPDFELWKITAPIMLQYSPIDRLTNPADMDLLAQKLTNSPKYVHVVDAEKFEHMDFVWGYYAAPIVYSKILSFFQYYYQRG